MRHSYFPVAIAVVLAACSDRSPVAGPTEAAPAPLLAAVQAQDDRYIVVFRSSVADPDGLTDALIRAHGGSVAYRYRTALKGFAGTLAAQALDGIRRNPNVDYVEADGVMSVIGSQSLPTNDQQWGLDRIDQQDLPLNDTYNYQNDGSGVRAYILDTGVKFDHVEYNGRASSGWDFIDNDANASDCHGHGTHVAGTVAGTTVGVAKLASIVSVRVLNCQGSGTWGQVIAGIDWVAANRVLPAVANMSLGGGFSSSVNQAVNGAVADGVTFAVAAGNSNANACNYSPASAADALTVGASTISDARSSFSNYGSCLDIFAPGSSIYSSVISGGYQSWNGTSMATPHVAGVAALYLAANGAATPAQVGAAIVNGASANKLSSIGTGSPNLLLYNQIAQGGGGGGNLPPSASFTSSCSNLACTFDGGGSTDGDGFIASYSWAFGDGGTSDIESPSHTYAAGGTYTVTLTVTDDDGATDIESKQVSVSPGASVVMHVGDLDGSATGNRNNWSATVSVRVVDQNGQPVSGAAVSGTWSAGASGNGSCSQTDANGWCSISKGGVKKNVGSVTFSITGVTKSGASYDPADNEDPDGDSTGTVIVIAKP